MILAAKAGGKKAKKLTEADAKDALSGILCRCTGYERPIQSIRKVLNNHWGENQLENYLVEYSDKAEKWQRVGKPEAKVDAFKLAQGKPAFTDDFSLPGMLYAKILHQPPCTRSDKKD